MIPSITAVRMSGADRESLPLLVLGPSLGTSTTVLWSHCAADLVERFDVVAWDLPGHGHNRAVPDEDYTLADLARGVLAVVDDILDQRGEHDAPFFVAGDSVGGGVAVQLALDAPQRVRAAAALCAGARFATPESWLERVGKVQDAGTAVLTSALSQKWFGPGFFDESPDVASALLHDLQGADDEGYVGLCRALAGFDVSARLGEVSAPLLVVAGADDLTTPPAKELADGVAGSRFVELAGVGHLAPAEAPARVAALLREHFLGETPAVGEPAGELGPDFAELAAAHASGTVWERPGLDPRSRAMVSLTALVARGHHDELVPHLQAARADGVRLEEVKELLLQTALRCGLPDAEAAFRAAQQVFAVEG